MSSAEKSPDYVCLEGVLHTDCCHKTIVFNPTTVICALSKMTERVYLVITIREAAVKITKIDHIPHTSRTSNWQNAGTKKFLVYPAMTRCISVLSREDRWLSEITAHHFPCFPGKISIPAIRWLSLEKRLSFSVLCLLSTPKISRLPYAITMYLYQCTLTILAITILS